MNAPRLWRLALALVFATISEWAAHVAIKLGKIDRQKTLDQLKPPRRHLTNVARELAAGKEVTAAELQQAQDAWINKGLMPNEEFLKRLNQSTPEKPCCRD